MTKCLIVEDEIAGQIILTKKLGNFYPECRIEAVIDNKNEAISYLKNNEVDIVFLDVEIKGGTGIEVIEAIGEFNFEVIFVTAYKDYAIEALNHKASYYLLKPIQDAALKKGMEVVLKRVREKRLVTTILVPYKNSQLPVAVRDIVYFKSEGAYSHIHTKEEQFLTSKNIGYYEQLLAASSFTRCHHSYLVNINQIDRLVKSRGGVLIMSNGDEVPVSQRRLNELIAVLQT